MPHAIENPLNQQHLKEFIKQAYLYRGPFGPPESKSQKPSLGGYILRSPVPSLCGSYTD